MYGGAQDLVGCNCLCLRGLGHRLIMFPKKICFSMYVSLALGAFRSGVLLTWLMFQPPGTMMRFLIYVCFGLLPVWVSYVPQGHTCSGDINSMNNIFLLREGLLMH